MLSVCNSRIVRRWIHCIFNGDNISVQTDSSPQKKKPSSLRKIYANFGCRVTDAFWQWTTDSIQSETNGCCAIFRVLLCERWYWHLLVRDTETVIYYFLYYFYPQHLAATRLQGNKIFFNNLNIVITFFFSKNLPLLSKHSEKYQTRSCKQIDS